MRRTIAATALLAALTAAALAGSLAQAKPEATSQSTAVTTLKIGVIPIADVAPLYLGIKKGFFRKQNLEIQPQLAAGGAAIIPSVVKGDYQFGFSNVVSEILAYSQGLKLQIVSAGVAAGKTVNEAWSGVLVREDSPIKTPVDLAGKTISVNTLKNIGDVTIKEALRKYNVDAESLRFVEIPFPDAIQALNAGRIDAAWVVEPFLTQGLVGGDRKVLSNYERTSPSLPIATYFTTGDYADKNPTIVKAFQTAMTQSLDYASKHPGEARNIVLTYTRINSGIVSRMQLPAWPSTVDMAKMNLIGSLMVRYGLVSSQPNLTGLMRLPKK